MWYKVKIKYRAMIEGKSKRVTEYFLHDAISVSDAETQSQSIHADRLKELWVVSVQESTLDVEFQVEGQHFYQVAYTEEIDGKMYKTTLLLAANTVSQAEERTERLFQRTMKSITVIGSVKSAILAVYHPKADQWKSDFINRSAVLADKGFSNLNEEPTVKVKPDKPKDIQAKIDFDKWPGDAGYQQAL